MPSRCSPSFPLSPAVYVSRSCDLHPPPGPMCEYLPCANPYPWRLGSSYQRSFGLESPGGKPSPPLPLCSKDRKMASPLTPPVCLSICDKAPPLAEPTQGTLPGGRALDPPSLPVRIYGLSRRRRRRRRLPRLLHPSRITPSWVRAGRKVLGSKISPSRTRAHPFPSSFLLISDRHAPLPRGADDMGGGGMLSVARRQPTTWYK